MQQWARNYLSYVQHRDAPRKQARIRTFMFEGTRLYQMSQVVEMMPLSLHLSALCFFLGLVEFIYTINHAIALYSLLGFVAFAGLYVIATVSPNFHLQCPYITPLSGCSDFLFQSSAAWLFLGANLIERIFHGLLLRIWRWVGSPNNGPTKWRAVLQAKANAYFDRLKQNRQRRVADHVMKSPSNLDEHALHWTLETLDETNKVEDFLKCIPGFFDYSAAPDATSIILPLMSEQPTSDAIPILGSRIHQLLDTCLPGASLLTEDQRNSRLRVCLKCLWYCLRAFNQNLDVPLVPYVSAIFASPQVIQRFQTEKNIAVRLLGRCFGSLVVKKLSNDISSRHPHPPTTEELACLSSILGANGEQVRGWLDYTGAIDLANIIVLASGELETLVGSETEGVPTDVMDLFQQTLGILAEGMSLADIEWDTDHVVRFHEIHSRFADAQVPDKLKEQLRNILDRLRPIPDSVTTRQAIP